MRACGGKSADPPKLRAWPPHIGPPVPNRGALRDTVARSQWTFWNDKLNSRSWLDSCAKQERVPERSRSCTVRRAPARVSWSSNLHGRLQVRHACSGVTPMRCRPHACWVRSTNWSPELRCCRVPLSNSVLRATSYSRVCSSGSRRLTLSASWCWRTCTGPTRQRSTLCASSAGAFSALVAC